MARAFARAALGAALAFAIATSSGAESEPIDATEQAQSPDAHVVEAGEPDAEGVRAGSADADLETADEPEAHLEEAGDPDARLEGAAAPEPPGSDFSGRPASAGVTPALAAAQARAQAADRAYDDMLRRDYPRGDARQAIIDEREQAHRALEAAQRAAAAAEDGEPDPAAGAW